MLQHARDVMYEATPVSGCRREWWFVDEEEGREVLRAKKSAEVRARLTSLGAGTCRTLLVAIPLPTSSTINSPTPTTPRLLLPTGTPTTLSLRSLTVSDSEYSNNRRNG